MDKSTNGLVMVGQTGSRWLPARSAFTPSNRTFCSYTIPDEIKYTQHSAAGIKQTPQKTHTTHWAPAVMASKTAHYSAT